MYDKNGKILKNIKYCDFIFVTLMTSNTVNAIESDNLLR